MSPALAFRSTRRAPEGTPSPVEHPLGLLPLARFGSEDRQRRTLRRDDAEGRKPPGFRVEGEDKARERPARVQVGVVEHAVGHQVAPVGTLAEIDMEADPFPRSGQVGDRGREPREELHVDAGVEPPAPDFAKDAGRARRHGPGRAGADREHILRGNEADQVDDEAVLLKNEEIGVLAADALHGGPDRLVGQNGRALLRELQEKEVADRAGGRASAEEPTEAADNAQEPADRGADPPVNPLKCASLAGKTIQGWVRVGGSLSTPGPARDASEMPIRVASGLLGSAGEPPPSTNCPGPGARSCSPCAHAARAGRGPDPGQGDRPLRLRGGRRHGRRPGRVPVLGRAREAFRPDRSPRGAPSPVPKRRGPLRRRGREHARPAADAGHDKRARHGPLPGPAVRPDAHLLADQRHSGD